MTIDEAILELKSENGYYANNGMTDVAEFNTKIIRWLEELKALKNGLNIKCDNLNEALEKGKKIGYNKALDDFVKFASDMPTVEEEDGEIRPMWLEEMAEQLKAGVENERSI